VPPIMPSQDAATMTSVGVGTSTSPTINPPPEVEQTIARLSAHKTVRGVMICSRDGPIIRQSGSIFEGESGKKYAAAVKKIIDVCKAGLEEVNDAGDELKFMRIRTKKHELMITPDEHYLLVVLQDPQQ